VKRDSTIQPGEEAPLRAPFWSQLAMIRVLTTAVLSSSLLIHPYFSLLLSLAHTQSHAKNWVQGRDSAEN